MFIQENIENKIVERKERDMATSNRKQKTQGGMPMKNFLPKAPLQALKVVSYEKISQSDEKAIVKFYEVLVPNGEVNEINIKMIVEEAFPVFEERLGKADFGKVKKYFGIDSAGKSMAKSADIMTLVSKLRTIENAQYYIAGYKELLKNIAKRLWGAPEEMTDLEKAKLLRVYMIIFSDYHFFAEDYSVVTYKDLEPVRLVNDSLALENNSRKSFYPEELFFLYEYKISPYKEDGILYDAVVHEICKLDKKLRKELLEFAELKLDGGRFISENKASLNQSFSNVRKLKMKINMESGVYPVELFSCKQIFAEWDLGMLYYVYKTLKNIDIKTCQQKERILKVFEGSRIVMKNFPYYHIIEDLDVSGETEKERFIYFFEYLAKENFVFNVKYIGDDELPETRKMEVGMFFSAIKFACEMGYITESSDISREFEIAELLIKKDCGKLLLLYLKGEISGEELKKELGIDKEYEKEVLQFTKPETIEEAAIRFAVKNGATESEGLKKLVNEFLIPANESAFGKFAAGEIDEEALKEQIGFDLEFTEMYFDLTKVNIQLIEARLLTLKHGMAKKNEMRKMSLVINLYCYIIEGQIPCGPKNKVPKRNKSLKLTNLRALVE